MSKPYLDDRELLELAAKAAGMTYLIWTPGASPIVPGFHRVDDRSNWSPLTDDGDALRLAVGLGINVNFGNQEEGAVVAFDFSGRFQDCEESGEPRAAYRRAVVRAAAEIGKGMP